MPAWTPTEPKRKRVDDLTMKDQSSVKVPRTMGTDSRGSASEAPKSSTANGAAGAPGFGKGGNGRPAMAPQVVRKKQADPNSIFVKRK